MSESPPSSGQEPIASPYGLPHNRLTRRRLLIGAGALGACGVAAGAIATRPWDALTGPSGSSSALRSGRGTLVLVTLYGGNDGLNTVIPYNDSAYHAARPNLAYQPNVVLPLADGFGLNPRLPGLKGLWDAKQLAVVRGVGYPNPSLSHFQSMDIWQTANPEGSGSGWLGRWLDGTGTDPIRAISLGSTIPTALRGEKTAATAITSGTITVPGQPVFTNAYTRLAAASADRSGLAALVANTSTDLLSVKGDLDRLHVAAPVATAGPSTTVRAPGPGAGTVPGETGGSAPAKGGGHRRAGKAPATSFADQMALVASLVKAGAPTRVYQVSLSSFDTHADEKANQERLLGELDAGVTGFFHSLTGSSQASDVVLMTYSEFGRRVAENASGGTDHGTASPLFVAGPAVHGGRFYGEQPSLTDLVDGDLKHNVDFRSVYATMLDRVVGVDSKSFLGASYPTLALV
ncbi:MAG: DUF1501 domain-containing protein [Actinomycetota bacterium]|nr:DUF1501 domain-containing protein [Actinomycetota bacterium]